MPSVDWQQVELIRVPQNSSPSPVKGEPAGNASLGLWTAGRAHFSWKPVSADHPFAPAQSPSSVGAPARQALGSCWAEPKRRVKCKRTGNTPGTV